MGEAGNRVTIKDGWIVARWSDKSELDKVRQRLIEERDRLRQARQTWMALNAVAGGADPRAAGEELVQDAMLTVADAIAVASARMLRRLSSPDTAFQGEDHEQYAELEPLDAHGRSSYRRLPAIRACISLRSPPGSKMGGGAPGPPLCAVPARRRRHGYRP